MTWHMPPSPEEDFEDLHGAVFMLLLIVALGAVFL